MTKKINLFQSYNDNIGSKLMGVEKKEIVVEINPKEQ